MYGLNFAKLRMWCWIRIALGLRFVGKQKPDDMIQDSLLCLQYPNISNNNNNCRKASGFHGNNLMEEYWHDWTDCKRFNLVNLSKGLVSWIKCWVWDLLLQASLSLSLSLTRAHVDGRTHTEVEFFFQQNNISAKGMSCVCVAFLC